MYNKCAICQIECSFLYVSFPLWVTALTLPRSDFKTLLLLDYV